MNQDYVGKNLKGQDFSEHCLDESISAMLT
jgi:hypothetical protein